MDFAGKLLFVLLLSISASASRITNTGTSSPSISQILSGNRKIGRDSKAACESWKFTVETNDAGAWKTVPAKCEGFVKHYMTGDRYLSDSDAVAEAALAFAKKVEITGDGKDAWVFDIDETLLSNLPYYAQNGFGTQSFDEASFDAWVEQADAPALPASLKLYNGLQKLGFTNFFLTGRSEEQRNYTEKNLLNAGYRNWEKLILRGASDHGTHATVYKSGKRNELEAQGYRIHGSSGDQWSDLLGYAMAKRSFKLPNPMYYIA